MVLLSRIRRGCLSKLLEVNKPCGVVKEACCGQREELSEVPSMRRPVVMEMASMAVVEGGKGRSGPFTRGEMGATAGVDWPRCVRLSSCVMLALIPLLSANS